MIRGERQPSYDPAELRSRRGDGEGKAKEVKKEAELAQLGLDLTFRSLRGSGATAHAQLLLSISLARSLVLASPLRRAQPRPRQTKAMRVAEW